MTQEDLIENYLLILSGHFPKMDTESLDILKAFLSASYKEGVLKGINMCQQIQKEVSNG